MISFFPKALLRKLPKASKRERGASLVEYALVIAMTALVTISAVQILGERVSRSYSDSANILKGPVIALPGGPLPGGGG